MLPVPLQSQPFHPRSTALVAVTGQSDQVTLLAAQCGLADNDDDRDWLDYRRSTHSRQVGHLRPVAGREVAAEPPGLVLATDRPYLVDPRGLPCWLPLPGLAPGVSYQGEYFSMVEEVEASSLNWRPRSSLAGMVSTRRPNPPGKTWRRANPAACCPRTRPSRRREFQPASAGSSCTLTLTDLPRRALSLRQPWAGC